MELADSVNDRFICFRVFDLDEVVKRFTRELFANHVRFGSYVRGPFLTFLNQRCFREVVTLILGSNNH